MLAFLADCYSPLLALFCIYYLRHTANKKLLFAFVIAYFYIYFFAYIEGYFGWWEAMEANFSTHTAVVMVLVFALISVNIKVGIYAWLSLLLYGALMTTLSYHSWFDILTTMLVCLPCWSLFCIFNRAERRSK